MDEMNNNNGIEMPSTPTNITEPVTPAESVPQQPVAQPAPVVNDFANNDDPKQQGGAYYSYQPNMAEQGAFTPANDEAAKNQELAKTTAKSAMIFGIIAAVAAQLCACFPVSIVLGIIAIVKATKAKKLAGRMPGMGIPGLICGIYGIVLGAFWVLYFTIFGFAFIIAFMNGTFDGDVTLGLQSIFGLMR